MRAVSQFDILNGATQLYNEVFDNTEWIQLGTDYEGDHYEIHDRYCMNPGCDCRDVFLHFVSYKKGFTLSLSLKSKKFKIKDVVRMEDDLAEKVVKHSLKDSDEAIRLFKKRYTEMKAAGREALNGVVLIDPEQQRTERNAPCPCGSGKKYKKCCGA